MTVRKIRSRRVSRRSLLPLLCCVLLMPAVASAEKEIDIYDTSLLVINQTPEIRRRAAVDMLANVFVRLSGSREVLKNPRVKRALADASKYVYEFSYQSTAEEITIAGTTYPASQLQLRFIASPLEAILLEEKLPLWSARRPETLVWLATDNPDNKPVKAYMAESSSLNAALQLSAGGRGLPLVAPLLDLEDRNSLPMANIWALDEARILQASQRYGLDAVLAGRISKNRRSYRGSFILNHQSRTLYFNLEGKTEQDVSDILMDRVADYFASIYAFVEDDSRSGQAIEIVVSNAGDFSVYARVTRYLESIKILDGAILARAKGEQLDFSVGYRGEPERLLKIFALDKKLAYLYRRQSAETTDDKLGAETAAPEVDNASAIPANNRQSNNPFALEPEPLMATTQLVFSWIEE